MQERRVRVPQGPQLFTQAVLLQQAGRGAVGLSTHTRWRANEGYEPPAGSLCRSAKFYRAAFFSSTCRICLLYLPIYALAHHLQVVAGGRVGGGGSVGVFVDSTGCPFTASRRRRGGKTARARTPGCGSRRGGTGSSRLRRSAGRPRCWDTGGRVSAARGSHSFRPQEGEQRANGGGQIRVGTHSHITMS